jgi:hypothetical protein
LQIKKIYQNVKPELLFDALKDLITKQGASVAESKLETYSLPDDSSSFISRGTLTFKTQQKESIRGYIVGSAMGETKLMLDIDEALFPRENIGYVQDALGFLLGSYEKKSS